MELGGLLVQITHVQVVLAAPLNVPFPHKIILLIMICWTNCVHFLPNAARTCKGRVGQAEDRAEWEVGSTIWVHQMDFYIYIENSPKTQVWSGVQIDFCRILFASFLLVVRNILLKLRFPGMTDLSWLLNSFNQQADNLNQLLGLSYLWSDPNFLRDQIQSKKIPMFMT